MKHLKIYLAGKMTGVSFDEMNIWRVKSKEKLLNVAEDTGYSVTVINPVEFYNFEEHRYQSDKEVEDYDLAHVLTSDVIVVNLEGIDTSIGTIIELHDANYHRRIPVIAFGDKETYEKLHPWIKRDITRVEDNMDNAIEYVKQFYMF